MATPEVHATALVPFRVGKSRLSHPAREALAQAFCDDVIAACRNARYVTEVVVVPEAGAGLNADIAQVAKTIAGPVIVVLADQPALTASALDAVIEQAAQQPTQSFVADAQGIGTTMLFAPSGPALTPHFGPRSRAAHRERGMIEIAAPIRARRDVDDDVDLWDAIRLGIGAHTRAALTPQP